MRVFQWEIKTVYYVTNLNLLSFRDFVANEAIKCGVDDMKCVSFVFLYLLTTLFRLLSSFVAVALFCQSKCTELECSSIWFTSF